MPERHLALTPEALAMIDTIARAGSFAAAARAMDKVPSALTYSVRQLEDALDVLLFDRSTRQARLTAAGEELLQEGRRLLVEMESVANRVRRVATGWETQLALAVDGVISSATLLELCEAFYALNPQGMLAASGTRLRLRTEVLTGTWEALVSGQADLAIGVSSAPHPPPLGIQVQSLGTLAFVFAVAPHHPLAALAEPLSDAQLQAHRAVAVADSALRLSPVSVNLLVGQDVLTVGSLQAKLEAQLRCLGCGFLPEPLARPHIETGRLVVKRVRRPLSGATLAYAWRQSGDHAPPGLALQWWLAQLALPTTRQALLERQTGLGSAA
ncbi:MAG: LysR substrate-binding domain-containing protein [Pseudomonadota bacterium]